MKKVKSTKNGGFPLVLDDLRYAQGGIEEAIKGLMSNFGIGADESFFISGCVISNTISQYQIAAGWMCIEGEICEVDAQSINIQASPTQDYYWEIVETFDSAGTKIFEDATQGDTYAVRKGVIKYGTPPSTYTPLEAARLDDILARKSVPKSSIMMYAGSLSNFDSNGLGKASAGLSGWALCDGQNGTIDMRGNFPVGYSSTDTDYNAVGKSGGEKTHQLSISEMPQHNHPGSTTDAETINTGSVQSGSGAVGISSSGTGTPSIASQGGGTPHENRPPFKTLVFMQRIS